MRICFFGNFSSGGTERATFAIANALAAEHQVFLINTCKSTPFFMLDGIKMEYLPSGSIVKRNIALFRYLKKNKIDVLITVEAMSGIFSLLPAKIDRCKHIIWEHANFYQTQGSRYIQKVRQLELKMADAYIVLTERDINNFKNNFKVKCKLDYIYNAVDEISDVVYDIESKTIISAGHIRKIKNFIVIPDIAKLVFEKHPDWKWKIYGSTEHDQYEELKKKIKVYGLENKIIFCGRYDDMDSEYRKSAIYVMTSLQEGLPMVLLEAKAHKLPLVSFDIETGPSEIIRDGVNGYLIEPYNIEAMAEKIIALIENDSLRKDFSVNSLLDIEKFDKQSIVDKWKKLLERL